MRHRAERLLNALPDQCTARRVGDAPGRCLSGCAGLPGRELCVVLYSGDTGVLFPVPMLLCRFLRRQGIFPQILPGLSSVQILAARIGRPWQNWNLVSAHSAACDPVAAVCSGRETFFLTGSLSASALCARLCEAGLGDLRVWVGKILPIRKNR